MLLRRRTARRRSALVDAGQLPAVVVVHRPGVFREEQRKILRTGVALRHPHRRRSPTSATATVGDRRRADRAARATATARSAAS